MFDVVDRSAVQAHAGALAQMTARLEPDAVPLPDVPGMWEAFDWIERLAGGAKLLLARRVDESAVWQQAGDRDAGVWLARHAGTSITGARIELATSKRLAKLPETAGALRRGELSVAQAEPIADAASRDGGAETQLLGLAGQVSLSELREECGRLKAKADRDPERTYERIRANRRLRHGTDSEGAWWLSGRGPVDDGGELTAVLGPIIDEIFHEARNEGRAEPREAYAWDALVELVRRAHDWTSSDTDNQDTDTEIEIDGQEANGTGSDDGTASDVHVDDEAGNDPEAGDAVSSSRGVGDDGQGSDLVTGEDDGVVGARGDRPRHASSGSGDHGAAEGVCGDSAEPAGERKGRVGRPRPRRRRSSNEKYLALLRVDLTALRRGSVEGDELCEITGLGPVPVSVARKLLGDAVLKLVLTRGVAVQNVTHLGRGPTVAQRMALKWQTPTCSALGCNRSDVQHDHRIDWAKAHRTVLGELDDICTHHHQLKTNHGWALVDGTGKRAMVPPDDPRHPHYTERRPTAGTVAA